MPQLPMRVNALVVPIVVTVLQCAALSASANAASEEHRVEEGRRLAHDFRKGNCLACHAMPTDPTAITKANIGPPLSHMRERFGSREVLQSQIWDAGNRNPNTVMPPFGKHKILTNDEIELIIDYLYTL
jgi:sulfur-oxidizing protein SoxX